MALWQPNEQGLNHILQIFRDSRVATNEAQQALYAALEQLETQPDYPKYLAFILSQCKGEREELRQRVGLLLKNVIKDNWMRMDPLSRNYCKQMVVATIGDESMFIRATVGTVVSMIIKMDGGFREWPGVLQHLLECMQNPNPNIVDGSFNALSKICEDNVAALDSDQAGLEQMIPRFVEFMLHPNPILRKYAIGSVIQFLHLMPASLAANMERFMMGLFKLTGDTTTEVRKRVCQAFVILLEVRPQYLLPQMNNIINFMLEATRDADEVVALEACEFWTAYCDNKELDRQFLRAALPQLVPVLVRGMRYSDIDLVLLAGDDEEDEHKPDKISDIRPRFHSSRTAAYEDSSSGGAGFTTFQGGQANDGDDEQFEDEDDDDDYEDEEVSDWNLRKCSAASLDTLSGLFPGEILHTILPILQGCLTSLDWIEKESGILALGAIAEGCFAGIEPHLPQLVQFLVTVVEDRKPLVRSITCWTLSRYAKWVMKDPNDESFFKPVMIRLLQRVLDRNKKVQEAACSAFATLEEEAKERLVPYLLAILQHLMTAFAKYQTKNLLILYDAIGTLADAVGPNLNRPEYTSILIPPIFQKWYRLDPEDRSMFPLLECLTCIAQALGPGFAPYAEHVFTRCLQIIEKTIITQQRMAGDPDARGEIAQNKEFIICALDLLSGLAEGLGETIGPLVAKSNTLALLYECMKDSDDGVRQSSFALLGDLAKSCIDQLRPHLEQFLPIAAANLVPRHVSICNNASWAIGEISMRVGEQMKPFVPLLLNHLVPILAARNLPGNLLENAAITLGRLGLAAPEPMAPHLEQYAAPWCFYLGRLREDIEKGHAFRGLCNVIRVNPPGILAHVPLLLGAIASWQNPPPQLAQVFRELLLALKSWMKESWAQALSAVHAQAVQHLQRMYGV